MVRILRHLIIKASLYGYLKRPKEMEIPVINRGLTLPQLTIIFERFDKYWDV